MDPAVQSFQFLDLSDAGEEDRNLLFSVLYNPSQHDYKGPDLPWTPEEPVVVVEAEEVWEEESGAFYHDQNQCMWHGPEVPVCAPMYEGGMIDTAPPSEMIIPHTASPMVATSDNCTVMPSTQTPLQHQHANMHHPMMPNGVPSNMYTMQQMVPSVYVNNVTANVNVHGMQMYHHHPIMTQPSFEQGVPQQQYTEKDDKRSMAGPKRKVMRDGNNRKHKSVDSPSSDYIHIPPQQQTTYAQPSYIGPFQHTMGPTTYYTQQPQAIGHHPNAQLATGHPLYFQQLPMLPPVYNSHYYYPMPHPQQQQTSPYMATTHVTTLSENHTEDTGTFTTANDYPEMVLVPSQGTPSTSPPKTKQHVVKSEQVKPELPAPFIIPHNNSSIPGIIHMPVNPNANANPIIESAPVNNEQMSMVREPEFVVVNTNPITINEEPAIINPTPVAESIPVAVNSVSATVNSSIPAAINSIPVASIPVTVNSISSGNTIPASNSIPAGVNSIPAVANSTTVVGNVTTIIVNPTLAANSPVSTLPSSTTVIPIPDVVNPISITNEEPIIAPGAVTIEIKAEHNIVSSNGPLNNKSVDIPIDTIVDNLETLDISVHTDIDNDESIEVPMMGNNESVQSESSSPVSSSTIELENTDTVVTPVTSKSKSWASLFKSPASNSPPKPMARVNPIVSSGSSPATPTNQITCHNKKQEDGLSMMGEYLLKYALNHHAMCLEPRGLTNRSNWCYINSTLQALLACPPFCNLLRSLPTIPGMMRYGKSSSPIIDSMVQFVHEFNPMPKTLRKEKPGRKEETQLHTGPTFEPSYVYKMLPNIKSETFKVEGRQEDAEEFLSCLLNALQDEMVEVMKLSVDPVPNGTVTNGDIAPPEEDDDSWQVSGSRKRIVTRKADFHCTPISSIFLGQIRSALHQAGAQPTATLQPFFTLQLDIQSDKVESVRDALEGLACREALEGYTCTKTRQEVEASRQITLEELPPILILHLKRFVYDKSGGSQKLLKKVDFPVDLDLGKELSATAKTKYNAKQKQYKLFAVVYHDGKEAGKGHYMTDAYHAGYGGWIRFDDSMVKYVSDTQLHKHSPPRVPYLLYYRRADTVAVQQPHIDNKR